MIEPSLILAAQIFTPTVILIIPLVGLCAGLIGGMVGVGGSLIMIPSLVIIFGQGDRDPSMNQHMYQAAAMIINVFVVVPATYRHIRANAVVFPAVKKIVPGALIMIFVGVYVSDLPVFKGEVGPLMLGRVMAVFMVYVIIMNTRKMFQTPPPQDTPVDQTYITWPRALTVGASTGFVAGLLGVGGGAIAVPLQQILFKMRLRNCIANSAAMICVTAGIGAVYKNFTLASEHNLDVSTSIRLALLLAPLAVVGGYIGGRLTHVMPLRFVRGCFIVLLILAAWKMAGIN